MGAAVQEYRLYTAYEEWEDLPYLVQYVGEDNLVVGSDWGHHGGRGVAATRPGSRRFLAICGRGKTCPAPLSTRCSRTTPVNSTPLQSKEKPMAANHAVVVDHAVPGTLAIVKWLPYPLALRSLVRVAAISLNRGETRRAMEAADGWCPGWDLAGVVTQAAANGSGPRTGARVVGFLRSGAWAESVVVPTNALAALPDAVTFAQAATLRLSWPDGPVCSPSAVFCCIGACALPGRPAAWAILPSSWRIWPEPRSSRRYAVPIRWPWSSRLALMTWSSGRTQPPCPARPVRSGVGISWGGAAALATLAKDGVCVSLGNSASHEVTCDIRQFRQTGRTTLYGFILFEELALEPAAVGLAHLAGLIAAGKLKPTISVEAPWTQIGQVARQLLDRTFVGKAVLHVADGHR